MKAVFVSLAVLAMAVAGMTSADAKGCIKGAIVGGIAGHFAGHGKVGAVAGCLYGHHRAAEKAAAQRQGDAKH